VVEEVRANELGLAAHSRRTQGRNKEAGARVGHGGVRTRAWRPRWPFREHLVGAVVDTFEPPFRHILCGFRSCRLKQSCFSQKALQLLLTTTGH
jgi:hypothetical protein